MKTLVLGALVVAIALAGPAAGESSAIRWTRYSEADRIAKSLVILEEADSAKNVTIAWVKLQKTSPETEADSLLIYNANSAWCGSGGCKLTVLTRAPSGDMREVFEVTAGSGIDERGRVDAGVFLGNEFTRGMRNLRLNGSITWIWNGRTYVLK